MHVVTMWDYINTVILSLKQREDSRVDKKDEGCSSRPTSIYLTIFRRSCQSTFHTTPLRLWIKKKRGERKEKP